MKLVADTNVLFSFFKKDSFTRSLILSNELKLIAPKKAEEEIIKYKELIKSKSKIDESQFKSIFNELKLIVKIFERNYYQEFLNKAEKISPDIADSEFLALCLKENLNLWSQEDLLKQQDKIKVINTSELIDIIF